MHPPTCWTRVGALFRPCAPWWCSGQKRTENVEKLLPVLCVGRGLVVHVSESCSGRFRVRMDLPRTAFSLHPLLSQKWVGAPTFVHCPNKNEQLKGNANLFHSEYGTHALFFLRVHAAQLGCRKV